MGCIGDTHLVEEDEWIGIAQEAFVVEGMDHSPFSEDSPVGVTDPELKLGQVVGAELGDLGVAQCNETGLQVLGQRMLRYGVISQPPGRVELSYRWHCAQLITAVVSTLWIFCSWQIPIRTVLTPAKVDIR